MPGLAAIGGDLHLGYATISGKSHSRDKHRSGYQQIRLLGYINTGHCFDYRRVSPAAFFPVAGITTRADLERAKPFSILHAIEAGNEQACGVPMRLWQWLSIDQVDD